MKQKKGDRCLCADALNFGEPQPDCSRCGGTGVVRKPDGDTGPVFYYDEKDEKNRKP